MIEFARAERARDERIIGDRQRRTEELRPELSLEERALLLQCVRPEIARRDALVTAVDVKLDGHAAGRRLGDATPELYPSLGREAESVPRMRPNLRRMEIARRRRAPVAR